MSPTALTTDDAARLAADLLDILPETATVERATWAPDSLGNRVPTWASVGTYPARFGPVRFTPADKDIAERFRNMQLWRVSFAVGTDVRITDRVLIGGLTLSVEGLHSPKSVAVELVIICALVPA